MDNSLWDLKIVIVHLNDFSVLILLLCHVTPACQTIGAKQLHQRFPAAPVYRDIRTKQLDDTEGILRGLVQILVAGHTAHSLQLNIRRQNCRHDGYGII